MPRTYRRGPSQNYRLNVSRAAFAYLVGEPMPEDTDVWEWFVLKNQLGGPGHRSDVRSLWAAVGRELLQEWTQVRPGTRPFGWWMAEAPEPRAQLEGVPVRNADWRGSETAWREREGVRCGSSWQAGTAAFEGSGQYLDRLGLWAPGERERAPREVFEPIKCGQT